MTFSELGLDPKLLQALDLLGFENPTEIQAQSIPALLNEDRDLLGLASTGTGKTAAFGLPLLHRLEIGGKYPKALILAPTRELALQITKELERFARFYPEIGILTVYGGTGIQPQRSALKKGVDILVATPGRLLDLYDRGDAVLSEIQEVVLDEADEMLNMGFWEDVTRILESLPADRRIRLFSATFPKEVEKLANKLMTDPLRVQVTATEAAKRDLTHRYVKIDGRNRIAVLKRLIDHAADLYTIVFTRTRMDAQTVADKLSKEGYPAAALHGDMGQSQRETVMNAFRNKQVRIMVATDVAARGIDVDDLTHVFHFHLPDESESYTHRSGRTARAGKSGISIALVAHNEVRKLRNIEAQLKMKLEQVHVPTGQEVMARRLHALAERIRAVEINPEIEPFVRDWRDLLEGIEAEDLLARVVQMELERLMQEYKNAPDLNKDAGREERPQREREFNDDYQSGGKLVKIRLAVGAADGLEWQDLKDMVRDACDLAKKDIVSVKVYPKNSEFLVEPKDVQKVLDVLGELGFNDRPLSPQISEDRGGGNRGGGNRGGGKPFGKREFGGGGGGGWKGGNRSGGGDDRPWNKKPRKKY